MTTLLEIQGMNCQSCAAKIENSLKTVPGVGAVGVDLIGGRATVEHDQSVEGKRLIAGVTSAGFEARVIPPDAEAVSPSVPTPKD